MKKWLIIGVSVLVLLVGTFMTVKKVSPVGWGWWGDINTSEGVALKGYDPVEYFWHVSSEAPVPGARDYSQEWGGVTWQFSSSENRDLFAENPEDYAPQFGGFCSFAVSKGFTADISPDAYCSEPNEFTGDYPTPLSEFDDWPDEDKPVNGVNAVIINNHVVEWL